MAKILVIDIETTGLNFEKDLILEIGIVELDLDNGNIIELFNSLIKEPEFNQNHYSSWIFQEDYIKKEEYFSAPPIQDVFDEIQKILDNYYVTAFNKEFDLTFLRKKGFQISLEFPCIMKVSARVMKIPSIRNGYKWPKMQQDYNFFFPEAKYTECHRALDDAYHEAQIINKLFIEGNFVEMEFSRELAEIYGKITSKSYNTKNIKKSFINCPSNSDEALYYLVSKFPLHYPKVRKILKETETLPNGCAIINLIDFGCGPFTFSLGFLEEIIEISNFYGGGAYKIRILGIDKSRESLMLGLDIINEFREKIKHKGITIELKMKFDNGDFDDVENYIEEWFLSDPGDYVFLCYPLSMSSGIRNFNSIVRKVLNFSGNSIFNAFVIETSRSHSGLDLNRLFSKFPRLTIKKISLETNCKKPSGTDLPYLAIYSNYKVIFLQGHNREIVDLLNKTGFNLSFEETLLIYNKVKHWLMKERLVDHVGIALFEYDLKYTYKIMGKILPNLKLQRFLPYKTQKGLKPNNFRDITLITLPYTVLSFLLLMEIGVILDKSLRESIYCSRACDKLRIDRFFEFFTIGYSKFFNFEMKMSYKNKLLCNADIKDYYDSIDREVLKSRIEEIFIKNGLNPKLIEVIFNCLGDQKGIPVGSAISPLVANLYLIPLDENIISNSNVIDYARYMDDIKIILNIDNNQENKDLFKGFLIKNLGDLELKFKKKNII